VPGALFLEVKRPAREADNSPPSSDEVKNAWRYTSTPIRLHGHVFPCMGQYALVMTERSSSPAHLLLQCRIMGLSDSCPCALTEHTMKAYWGSGGMALRILDPPEIDGSEWSASHPGRFFPGKESPVPIV
jgi:hypothetical protein